MKRWLWPVLLWLLALALAAGMVRLRVCAADMDVPGQAPAALRLTERRSK